MTDSKAMSLIHANVNVGIDEVVSVFVSKYEDQLFERKDLISSQIKQFKKQLVDLNTKLEQSIDRSKYDIESFGVLGLSSTLEKVNVVMTDSGWYNKDSSFQPHIKVIFKVRKGEDSSNFTDTFVINQSDVDQYNSLNQQISDSQEQLTEVMGLIKSIGRKERQIRGKIAEKKLEESGFEGLLGDSEILKLVNL